MNNEFWAALDRLIAASEIKVLLGCTEAEKQVVLCLHNDSPNRKGLLIRRDVL